MPELPEVETICRGLEPLLVGRRIAGVITRAGALRLPIDPGLDRALAGKVVQRVSRRAKYLLLDCGEGGIVIHLGMSGHLQVVPRGLAPGRHDHVDLLLDDGQALRFCDPRRFGVLLWTPHDPRCHPLLAALGPEPFDLQVDGEYLFRCSRGRILSIKPFIMDQRIVVGVGNIYASEALFRAGIAPARAAGQVSRARYQRLVEAIREVLQEAIAAGGTTIRDFRGETGRPGYFARELKVYGRDGQPCPVCGRPIRQMRLGQRSTYFCPVCQKG